MGLEKSKIHHYDKEFLIYYLFVCIVNEKNAMLLYENKNCK